MSRFTRVCIVVPTYNEAGNIGALIDEVFRDVADVSMLVVDDDSPDGTASIVRKKMEQYPTLSLLERKGERGFASAYRAGFKTVFEDGTAEFLVTMDGDFSHNPRYINDFLRIIHSTRGPYDCIIGSRYVKGGGVQNWGFKRRMLSKFGNLYGKTVLGLPIRDITAGFLCIRTSFLKKLPWQDMQAEGYAWQMELKRLLYLAGAKIYETPIIFEERREGVSKISRRIIFEGLVYPIRLRLRGTPEKYESARRVAWQIFWAALAVRCIVFGALLFWLGQGIFVMGDTSGYEAIARHMLAGNGFSWNVAYHPVLQDFRPPFYPIVMAGSLLLSGNFIPLIILQLVLSSCVPVLTYLLGKEFIGSRRALLVAAGIAIFEPLLVIFSSYLLTDSLYLFFSLLGILMAVRFLKYSMLRDALIMGGALGIATLTRAVGAYLILYILLFVAWEWWQKKEARTDLAKRMSAGALLFLAIVVPWIARNYRDFGTLSVSSEAPWALYFDYVPSLYSVDRGLSFPDARTLARAQLKEADPSIDFANRISPSLLAQQALTRIKEEKSGVLKLQVINTVWFFTNDNYAYHLDRFGLVPDRPPLFSPTQLIIQEGVKSVPIIFQYLESVYFIPVIGRLFWVFITLFALLGFIFLFLQKNTSRMLVIFMAGLILYYYTTASPIGLAGEGRLRMPASPMLFLFAAAGVIYAWHYIQTKRRADYSK